MKRFSPLVLFLLLLSGCASLQPSTAPVHVVIVSTTDVHGWYNGHVETPSAGGPGVLWGGVPAFASYVRAIREENGGRVVVVDSGDMFQGTLESNLFEGEPVVRAYNLVGYAAAAVGNHEFDFGPVGPDAIARIPGQDSLGALKRNAALASFPMLSANMIERATGRTPAWAKRYTMVRTGGVNVGIIGLSTPDTPNVTMAANVRELEFTDPVAATITAAEELREAGADAIVVIAHMGGVCTNLDDPHDLSSCRHDQEAMEFLEKLPHGTIDAFFAGHTHARMRQYVNGVPALQAGPFSGEFGTLDLWIDPQQNRVTRSDIRPHTMICSFVYSGTDRCDPRSAPANAALVPRVFDGQVIHPDARITSTVEPFLRLVAAKRDEKLGIRTAAEFGRSHMTESALGDLLADALREATGADMAMMNSGGIRADLPAGEITYAHLFAVSPFDNFPAVVTLSGSEVEDLLRATTNGGHGIMQVSGVRYTYDAARDAAKPFAERDRLVSVTLPDGAPLDPAKLYTVVMPDFVAAGGDGTAAVMAKVPKERIQILYAKAIRDAVIRPLAGRPQPLTASIDGRITVLNEEPRRP